MVALKGGPIGPSNTADAYRNLTETDRIAAFQALGGRQGILTGFVPSVVAGQMALAFTPGIAPIEERRSDGTLGLGRGYVAWTDGTEQVTFPQASAGARNDAVILAVSDIEEGAAGSGGLTVGPHLTVVPGVSGVTTPRTTDDINSFVGRGGWIRVLDQPILPTATQIDLGSAAFRAFRIRDWNTLPFTAASGWNVTLARYKIISGTAHVEIAATYTGSTITPDSGGNVSPDITVGTITLADLQPTDLTVYGSFVRNGVMLGSWRINTSNAAALTDMYPGASVVSGQQLTFRMVYTVAGL